MKFKALIRSASLTLSLLFVLFAFAGCKSEKNEGDDTTQDSVTTSGADDDGFVKDDLPATMDFDGRDVSFMVCSSYFADFYQEGASPDIVQNEVYSATVAVNERLNVSLKFVKNGYAWDDRGTVYTKVCNDIMTGLYECDILVGSSYVPMYGSVELFHNLESVENINLDKPWYNQGYRAVWNGSTYCIQGDGVLANIKKLSCVFFNKQTLEDRQITEDLYKTVYDKGWTLEKLETLIANTYYSVDGTDSRTADDFYGVTFGDGNSMTPFGTALGVVLYTKGNDGSYTYNAGSTRNVEVMDAIRKFVNSNNNVLTSYNNESEEFKITPADGGQGVSRVFTKGNSMFMFGKFENGATIMSQETLDTSKIGVLPYPKYDTNQTDYAVTTDGASFYVPITASDVACAGAVLEAWNSQFYRTVVPLYFESVVQLRYSADNEMSQMFDFIRSKLTCNFENMFQDPDLLSMSGFTVKSCVLGMYGLESWSVTSKKNQSAASAELANIMSKYGMVNE